jgi:hypothetical protein
MTERPRSDLLYELTRPLSLPEVIIPEGPLLPPSAYENNVDARHIPVSIVPNSDLVPQLLDSFYDFCEQHPDRGNDPVRLACIRFSRELCGNDKIKTEEDGTSFLSSTVFTSARRSLEDLEQTTPVRCQPRRLEVAIGVRATDLWFDQLLDGRPVRAVWHQKSPQEAMHLFRDMDDKAQARVNFNPRVTSFEGADSVIVKVRSSFLSFWHSYYKLMGFLQGAVETFFRGSRYVVYHSGFDMIVHQLVPLNQNQYYLEASPRIPMDSQRYLHMAVIAAIVFDARVRAPAAPLIAPPLIDAELSVDRYYNGLKWSSRSVSSPSQFISSFFCRYQNIPGSAPF